MTDISRIAGGRKAGLPHRTANRRISARIARYLILIAVLLAVLTVTFGLWITREHDRLAASSSSQMVRGGLAALEETLRTVTMDFAIWPDAVTAIANDDRTWVWENIGISAAVTETTDLMMIQGTDGTAPYGWTPGMGATPSTDLIPPEATVKLRALLDELSIRDRRAVTTMFRAEDKVWLLASARIVTADPDEDPETDAEIPRLIFGYVIDDDLLQSLGRDFLIDDLHLEPTVTTNDDSIFVPLMSTDGTAAAYVAWSPPRPGEQILKSVAPAMVIGLSLMMIITIVSAQMLSRSARRLEMALQTAESASRSKSDFIANISHELRTPMNGIFGLTRLLQQSDLDERQSNIVSMLSASTETQMHLIDDLLDTSAIENGRLSLNVAPFSAADTVQGVVDLHRIEAEKKGLELVLDITDPDRIQVLGDRGRFRQVCANIIGNAVKFTDQGKVGVSLRVRKVLGEAQIQFEVTDTGPGIPAAEQDAIFDRFGRGTDAQRSRADGSGLGLSIATTIVTAMGGTLNLSSKPGNGATFTVELNLDMVDTPTRVA